MQGKGVRAVLGKSQSRGHSASLENMTAVVPQHRPTEIIVCLLIEQSDKFLKSTLSLSIFVLRFPIVKSASVTRKRALL